MLYLLSRFFVYVDSSIKKLFNHLLVQTLKRSRKYQKLKATNSKSIYLTKNKKKVKKKKPS